MTTKEKLLHGAAAGSVVVEEVSRRWEYATDERGFIITATMLLVAVQIVYYLIEIWKFIRGKKVLVREWRSRRREVVLATYRPEADRRHPNYRGRR